MNDLFSTVSISANNNGNEDDDDDDDDDDAADVDPHSILLARYNQGKKIYEREVQKEEKRCQDKLNEFDKTKLNKKQVEELREECMVCLEELPDDLHHYTPKPEVAKQFFCCGKWICIECSTNLNNHYSNPLSSIAMACPHCRAAPYYNIDTGRVGTRNNTKKLAHMGQAWAQAGLAFYYHLDYSSNSSSSKNSRSSSTMKQVIHWHSKAADQNFTRSETEMGLLYLGGVTDIDGEIIIREDFAKAKHFLERAARKGDEKAMHELAEIYICHPQHERNATNEIMKPFDLLTLAAYKGSAQSQTWMGLLYSGFFGTDNLESMSGITDTTRRGRDICALYWLQKAIDNEHRWDQHSVELADGYVVYAKVLIRVAMEQLGSTFITGMCPIPRAYSSIRDVVDVLQEDNIDENHVVLDKYLDAKATMLTMEQVAKQMGCAQCGRGRSDSHDDDDDDADDDSSNKDNCHKLTRCGTCKIMYYCSRKCQAKHWKAGHKLDCCDGCNFDAQKAKNGGK
jgi:hypothetical protein